MQKLAANLTEKMLRRKLISPEQAEWCAYLVECKLEQMLCFSVLIALGCLIAPLWEVLLLNWGVVFLRRKANGLHLHTFWGCMLSSLFCKLTALWACEKVTPAVAVLLLSTRTPLIVPHFPNAYKIRLMAFCTRMFVPTSPISSSFTGMSMMFVATLRVSKWKNRERTSPCKIM